MITFLTMNGCMGVENHYLCSSSDTKCGVKRNNLFSVLIAEVLRGEPDGIIGPVGFHIDL